MSHGGLVRLTRSVEGLPAGSCGRERGFYRRPERTEVLVFFDRGRIELLPESILVAVETPAAAPASVWERCSDVSSSH